jgi:hypothetical protein
MTANVDELERLVDHRPLHEARATTLAIRRFARRVASIAALAVIPCIGFAHESEPPLDATPAMAAMRYCQTQGVRAAWGAQARFLGAPATFRYIPEAPLRKMFMADIADMQADAIYVLDELNLEERRAYEESAFYGWKQADRWVAEGRERPDYEVLAAVFYQSCKQELSTQ